MIHRLAAHVVEAGLRIRAASGRADALRERLVLSGPAAVPAPADVWLHAASVGELTSARPVVVALARSHGVLVTTNTCAARDMARGWGWTARLAPLDLPGALGRFLDGARPRLLVTVEGEIWPLRSCLLARRAIPQAVIGARLSARSARRWRRVPGLARRVLGRIAALSAQDADSEARLLSLGLPRHAVLPRLDLKLLAPARLTPPPPSAARDRTVLAASTHKGEEAAAADAWIAVRRHCPDIRLIVVVRHPRRGDEVAALLAGRGLVAARRSRGETDGPVLLVDVLGETERWYRAAGLCLVGGSLTDRGGHTPWEPAAHGCAILHGPHVANFRAAYAALDAAGAAQAVEAQTLAGHLSRLVGDPGAARAMGQAARETLLARAGDPAALIERLRELAGPPARPDIGDNEQGLRR